MRSQLVFSVALIILASLPVAPALADGEVQITHAKALAGNVTAGDAAGYPVTVSQPGVYELASNLIVPANKIGIHITAPLVTIDLNDFALQGSGVAAHGIWGGADSGTIRNGTITRFKHDGIHTVFDYWIVENMRVILNGRDGISLTVNNTDGTYHRVVNNTVVQNGEDGIACAGYCHVEGNTSSNNGGQGVIVSGGTVLGNTIMGNDGYGIYAPGNSGFGNNTLSNNNSGGDQVSSGTTYPLDPNFCYPTAC